MVCARSTFERTPAGIRDHHAGKLDLPPPHPDGLPMRELIEPVAGVLSDPGERISESLQISMTDVEGRIRVMG